MPSAHHPLSRMVNSGPETRVFKAEIPAKGEIKKAEKLLFEVSLGTWKVAA